MSTQTSNLNLVKQANSENWSNDIHNANLQKIDDFAGNANATYITNQYSNVLDAINALRASKTFPFTIQKAGNASYGDLPSGLSSTCEWNLICYGNKERITAVLTAYTGASSMNGWSWTANIYNGAYTLNWTSVNSQLTTKMPSTAKICVDLANATRYTFPVTKANTGAYSYFLLVGGSSTTNGFVYHGFVHVSGNYAIVLTLIGGTAVPGIAASYDGTNLVFTVTNTQYGGLRLIWLG